MKNEVVLLLGCNLGDRESFLNKAVEELCNHIGPLGKKSSVYESEAWGFESSNTFLNQVVVFNTGLKPEDILNRIQKTENDLGRIRISGNYETRIIDIDILFYNNIIMKTRELAIPHPSLHRRRFTLEPLNEILPQSIHPIFNKSIKSLLEKCEDKLWVKKWES